MLAIEPAVAINSSSTVNPGVGGSTGVLDLDPFFDQRIILETVPPSGGAPDLDPKFYATISDLALLPDLRWSGTLSVPVSKYLTDIKLARVSPGDATKLQLLHKMHIVYPSDWGDVMSLRKGGRLPIAVLAHGAHTAFYVWSSYPPKDPVPSHQGYDALQRKLASYGIVSVSIDMNIENVFGGTLVQMRAETLLLVLDYLRGLDSDPASRFHERLDFDKVALMGHSRGGDAVVQAALLNAAKTTGSRYGIKAVCSVAPTDFTGTTTSPNTLMSSAATFYLVLYGALDADVGGWGGALAGTGTGFRLYDRAQTDKAMFFFDRCNHNRFNSYWNPPDEDSIVDKNRLLSPEDHETLLADYVGALFQWKLLGKDKGAHLLDGSQKNSVRAGASIQWSFGRKSVLDDFAASGGLAPAGSRTLSGAAVKALSALIPNRTNHQESVLQVFSGGPSTTDIYKLTLTPTFQDWTSYDVFTFRVCADFDDSSETSVINSQLPKFTLVFVDAHNNVVRVASSSFLDQLHEPIFHDDEWKTVPEHLSAVRLETVVLDLTQLTTAGLDLQNVLSVSIVLDSPFSKDQYFDSFQLVAH